MSVTLRPYQAKLLAEVMAIWARAALAWVCMVLPTGGGKTAIIGAIVGAHVGGSVVVAHRDSLVLQISMALARCGVRHRIIGPEKIQRAAARQHLKKLGQCFVYASAPAAVASVQTLLGKRAQQEHGAWFKTVTLFVCDEAHHLLKDNTWGRAAALFPNAKGLGPTATPLRADGKGLGRHADGLFDAMVIGPTLGQLIKMGYLTPYKIYCPPGDFNRGNLAVGSTGDFTDASVKAETRRSTITGDVVKHYQRIAPGKLGFTFAVDVETAKTIGANYEADGVRAEVLDGTTDPTRRIAVQDQFALRQIFQIVNCQLYGEGTDVPVLDVISMTAPTESFGKFVQEFGRPLRLSIADDLARRWETFTDAERRAHIAASDKPFAIIIDHVGNVERHGLPDNRAGWSLDRRERRGSNAPTDVVPTTKCPECTRAYERLYASCPYCGYAPEPVSRKGPKFVDGDLFELDAETLARLRGETADANLAPSIPHGASHIIGQGIQNKHWEKMRARARLAETVALWAGWRQQEGDTAAMAMRRFWHSFGIDTESAKALNRADSDKLNESVRTLLTAASVVSKVPFEHNEEL